MKRIGSLLLAAALLVLSLGALSFSAAAVGTVDAYKPDDMRVPRFGMGTDWSEGLNLLSFETEGLSYTTDGYCVVGITTDSVMKLEGVDFGDLGPQTAYLRAGSGNETGFTMEVRLDAVDGTLLGTFSLAGPTSSGWDACDTVEAEFEVSADVTGVHTLYFVNTMGAMNFFGVHFDEKESDVERGQLDAYSADEMRVPWFGIGVDWLPGSGLNLLSLETPELQNDGYNVTGVTTGSVMKLESVEFGSKGPQTAYLRGACGEASGFTMEVRLDAQDGPLLGTFSRTTAADWGWSVDDTQPMAQFDITLDVTGTHTLYFINTSGAMNFFGVHFDERAETAPAYDFAPTMDGASVRVTDPMGLRFKTTFTIPEELKPLLEDGSASVSYGMLLLPTDMLDGELTRESAEVLDIPAEKFWAQDEDHVEFTGVLIGIPEIRYDYAITARSYAVVTVDGAQTTYYCEAPVERSIYEVAKAALPDYESNPEVAAALQAIIDAVEAA